MALTLPAMLNPLLALLGLGLGIGAVLGYVARTFRLENDPVIEQINELLPQTQCGQCGYPGCKPYAEAIAAGDAINKCPPGGDKTIQHLAGLLNIKALSLDNNYGTEEIRKVAFIREAECIGCAKCIPACPVDAILGAPKFMHTVIENECTGCDLCVEPCPVDCIDMIPMAESMFAPATAEQINDNIQACINCGWCIDECPVDILPHELYRACQADDPVQAQGLNLMHCIECSRCDTVCPSHIPLTESFQTAKIIFTRQEVDKSRAVKARKRFELHQRRMGKFDSEEEVRRIKRATLANRDHKAISAENIQAALERVKAKKQLR